MRKVNRNALVDFLGKNAMSGEDEPKPKSVKSIKGLSPSSGTGDEKKLNHLKAKK